TVDPLKAGKRWPGKAKLRVKVVFKNECIVSAGKIEQHDPALETHRHAERVLMRRRYVNQFRLILFWRSADHHSFLIQRLRNQFSTCQGKDSPRLMKTRIFNPHRLAWIQQRHGAD